jgi:peptidoglycan/xylan/chitin deacetylase (PgdA/CDA1 family)
MSLRHLAKTVAAEALCRTGADRLWTAPQNRRELVLGYHQVVDDVRNAGPSIPAMIITTAMLEKQLDWVGRHYRFVSLGELGQRLESGATEARPLAAVTFDDGYRDVYEHAFPLLRRKGIPGAVFVVTDFMGTDRVMMHDRVHLLATRIVAQPPAVRARLVERLEHLEPVRALGEVAGPRPPGAFALMRALLESLPAAGLEQLVQELVEAGGWKEQPAPALRVLDWDMVRTMHRGGFTIGSHTSTHPLLTREEGERVRQELSGSRERLEREVGAPVRHFAYPDGRFDGAVVGAVAQAGYRFAYTTCRHRDAGRPLLTVPRRLLWENSCRNSAGGFSSSLMRGQVRGLFDLVGRCRQSHRAPAPASRQPMTA